MCRQALKPRLLTIVGLVAALAFYNRTAEHKVGLVEESALLAGFLSYKVVTLSDFQRTCSIADLDCYGADEIRWYRFDCGGLRDALRSSCCC